MLAAVPLDAQPPFRPQDLADPIDQTEAAFARRLAELERSIEAALDKARGSIRFSPLRRAVWRALLLPVGYVSWSYRQQLRAGLGTAQLRELGEAARAAGDRAAYGRAMDGLAVALVVKAALGSTKAGAVLFDIIEGRPGPRRPDRSSDPPPMDLEPLVRLLNERR